VAAVAQRYGVQASEVIPCLGTSGALFIAFATLIERDDTLLVEDPSYESLWRVAGGLGARVERFARTDGRLDPDVVLAAITPGTRVVAISNPHNPTSAVADDPTLRVLARALDAKSIWLLVDEAYLEMIQPKRSARRLGNNVITCSSTTKCLGVPWARAGWLMLPAEKASAAVQAERHAIGNAPPASWAWGELALGNAERLLERARRVQAGKRELIEAFAERHSESLRWTPPPAASLFGWMRDARGRTLLPLIERGIESSGVIVSPGEFFGDPSAFRISWTTSARALERGLELLAEVLEL
jgi:aspartate/methionine/tyrosine aminotransferase